MQVGTEFLTSYWNISQLRWTTLRVMLVARSVFQVSHNTNTRSRFAWCDLIGLPSTHTMLEECKCCAFAGPQCKSFSWNTNTKACIWSLEAIHFDSEFDFFAKTNAQSGMTKLYSMSLPLILMCCNKVRHLHTTNLLVLNTRRKWDLRQWKVSR